VSHIKTKFAIDLFYQPWYLLAEPQNIMFVKISLSYWTHFRPWQDRQTRLSWPSPTTKHGGDALSLDFDRKNPTTTMTPTGRKGRLTARRLRTATASRRRDCVCSAICRKCADCCCKVCNCCDLKQSCDVIEMTRMYGCEARSICLHRRDRTRASTLFVFNFFPHLNM